GLPDRRRRAESHHVPERGQIDGLAAFGLQHRIDRGEQIGRGVDEGPVEIKDEGGGGHRFNAFWPESGAIWCRKSLLYAYRGGGYPTANEAPWNRARGRTGHGDEIRPAQGDASDRGTPNSRSRDSGDEGRGRFADRGCHRLGRRERARIRVL